MVAVGGIACILSGLLLGRSVFAAETENVPMQTNCVDMVPSIPLSETLKDKVSYDGVGWSCWHWDCPNYQTPPPAPLLEMLGTIDQLFKPDWSLLDVSVYQVIFIYEKMKEFEQAHGRLPISLTSFLEPHAHVLNGLESKLAVVPNQRLAAFLVKELYDAVHALDNGGILPDWLFAGKRGTADKDEIGTSLVVCLEKIFRTSLGLDLTLAVLEAGGDTVNEAHTAKIMQWLYRVSGKYSFLPFSSQPISMEQRRQVYALLKKHLPANAFAPSSEAGLALAVMYGSVADMEPFHAVLFPRILGMWFTAYFSPDSRHVYVSHLWSREDAGDVLQLVKSKLPPVEELDPLNALAYLPESKGYLHFKHGWQLQEFSAFLYKCVTFSMTRSRDAFESGLFSHFLASAQGTGCDCYGGEVWVGVINLAMARGWRQTAETLFRRGQERCRDFDRAVRAALTKPEFVHDGPLVERYVSEEPVAYDGIWGRIVTSAVVRSDAKLLALLRAKLQPENDRWLRPFLGFPGTPFYIDIYCQLFGAAANDCRQEALAGYRALRTFSMPMDAWATSQWFFASENALLARLGSPLDGSGLGMHSQLPLTEGTDAFCRMRITDGPEKMVVADDC